MPKINKNSDKIQPVVMDQKKTITGKVISDKMNQTAVVEVVRFIAHPIYGKRLRRSIKFHAHNSIGAKDGDQVNICEIKPMSKTVNWKVVEILK